MAEPVKRSPSGNHPAVTEYRRKIASIAEHTSAPLEELDEELSEYLETVRSSSSPPPPTREARTALPGR